MLSKYDVGDKVYHIREQCWAFVVKVSPSGMYSLAQSREQQAQKKISWCAWLEDSDLSSAPPTPWNIVDPDIDVRGAKGSVDSDVRGAKGTVDLEQR